MLAFDDIQWGEETFLDLLEHVVDWSRDAPILVLCLARPELVDVRTGWGGGQPNATSVLLGQLAGEECELLVQRLPGEGELDEQAREGLVARTGGNPLFVEEMLAMLLDEGLLQHENGHWSVAGDVGAVAIPGTIHALLAARLDRLPAPERRVIERGAVEGEVFHREAVAGLLGESDLDVPLRSLIRKEVLRPARGTLAGADAFRFRHLLIRDAAYSAIPKEVRADLHRRFADWLERTAGDRRAEYEEVLGYHLEQAFRYHAELGRRTDEEAVETAARGARWLGAAGRRAADRGDLPAATKLLERASGLLPEDDERRLETDFVLGWALTQSGEFAAAESIVDAVIAGAAARGDRRLELRGLVARMDIVNSIRPEGAAAETFRLADQVLPELEALGDDRGLAHAWRVTGYAHNTLCRYGAAIDALERGLAHAERAGDAALRSEILAWLATRLVRGLVPAGRGLDRCRELLEQATGDRPAEAGCLAGIAMLEAISGRFDEARAAESRSRGIKEELGLRFVLAVGGIWKGELELLAGDFSAGEGAFRAAADFLGERGEKNFYPTAAAGLARVLFLQERYDEAWEALRAAEAATASDDLTTIIWTNGTRGRLLAVEQRLDEAQTVAARGVELALETDDLSLQADALIELAEVVPDGAEASAALADAIRIAEQKGNVVLARQARERLERLR